MILKMIILTIIKAISQMNTQANMEVSIRSTTQTIFETIFETITEIISQTVTETGILPTFVPPTECSKLTSMLTRILHSLVILLLLIICLLYEFILHCRSSGVYSSPHPFVSPPIHPVSSPAFPDSQRPAPLPPTSKDNSLAYYDSDKSGRSGIAYPMNTPNRNLDNVQETSEGGESIQKYSRDKESCFTGREAVQTVLNYPFYTNLWKSRQVDENGNGVIYEEAVKMYQDSPPDALLHNLIRECVKLKKLCRLFSARVLFLELLCNYCDDKLAWREFIRMEFELGECRNAQFLLQRAMDLFPLDQSFKIKQVRVNERLQDEDELLQMAQMVMQKQSSKFSRILVSCLTSLGRLGNQKAITQLEDIVFSFPFCTFLETYEFFYFFVNAFSCTFMLNIITQLVRKKFKKDCFLVYSHEYVEYLFLNIEEAEKQSKYAKFYLQLLPSGQKSPPEKGHWEVFLSRMQYRARIILLIYSNSFQEVFFLGGV